MKLRIIGLKVAASQRAKVKVAGKVPDSFYQSPAWRALMDEIIRMRGRICQDPEHDASKPKSGIRIFGDHIIERRDGGAPLDAGKILLRCGSCHTRKTAVARAARYHGGAAPTPFGEAPVCPRPSHAREIFRSRKS